MDKFIAPSEPSPHDHQLITGSFAQTLESQPGDSCLLFWSSVTEYELTRTSNILEYLATVLNSKRSSAQVCTHLELKVDSLFLLTWLLDLKDKIKIPKSWGNFYVLIVFLVVANKFRDLFPKQ